MPALPRRADHRGDHLIVCGDGPLAYRITEELTSRYGERVTVVLPSRQRRHGPQISALPRVRVLEHAELNRQAFTDAGVQAARAMAVVWQDDVGNFHAGLRAQELNPGLRLVLAAATRYSLSNALYLTLMDLTGSALTNPALSGPEKVSQVLLTLDGMAFIPVITAIVVGARLTGSDAPGIAMARQLGLPVVIGDATREQTLRAASLDTCIALVSVTSQDVVNLETALNARALREDLRVVLRLTDDDLAERLQKTSGSRSPPASLWPMTAVLDHLAIGAATLTDGWELFGALLGGSWAYGGDSPGFWFGQLKFAAGPKIELLTPTGGPDAAFLDRFLAAHGAGPHHFNFVVPDIEATLTAIRAFGIEPVGVNLADPSWKEAFLHPRSAHGIVIQVAQQAGSPPPDGRPEDLPRPGPSARLTEIGYRVGDLAGATRLFTDVLDGHLEVAGDDSAELTWPGGKRIVLVREDGLPLGGSLHHVRFARTAGAFSARERQRAGLLAGRLGLTVQLA